MTHNVACYGPYSNFKHFMTQFGILSRQDLELGLKHYNYYKILISHLRGAS